MRKWQDKDGNKRTSAEVIVDNAYFAGARGEGGSTYSAPSSGYPETEALIGKYQAQNFDMIQGDDEQLPF
jgi:single-strand DNA-binding protein